MRITARWVAVSAVLIALLASVGVSFVTAQAPTVTVSSVAVLDPVRLGAFENAARPGTVADDHGINIGGLGSGLWHDPTDPPTVFWTITDRGPNGQIPVGSENRRTFPVPDFSPAIVKVEVQGQKLVPVKTLVLTGTSGKPITGLSNRDGVDEVPYDYAANQKLNYNQSGLDTEDLVHTTAGEFWTVDEYSPSLVRIDATGKVLKRYVPVGVQLPSADYTVVEALPAILAKRTANRGFEGLTISPDGKTLYMAVQSPLRHPNREIGDASRNTRILAFDIASEKVTAEYVYQFQPYTEFNAPRASEMKISALAAIDATSLLVDERTDPVAKLYRIDLTKATNVLGTKWDDPATSPALEALNEANPGGITPLPKYFVADLSKFSEVEAKVEGLAILDPSTIAVLNDNDFSFSATPDAQGKFSDLGVRQALVTLKVNGGFSGVAAPFAQQPTPAATATSAATKAPAATPAPPKTGSAGILDQTTGRVSLAMGLVGLAVLFGVVLVGRSRRS
ncbi:MAG: esterase-like activity of phytase family protein [Dehalococcoidia bacterium]